MTFTPLIYDWRPTLCPIDQVFRSGGQAVAGGMTLGGVSVEYPEPGGRAELLCRFPTRFDSQANVDASWTISRILNGNVMRIRLSKSIQLVPATDLGGSVELESGVPWDNGLGWDNGFGWQWEPAVPIAASAAKGAAVVLLDFSSLGQVLQPGHVFGFRHSDGVDTAHVAEDVVYNGSDVASIAISPPLRRAVEFGEDALFRPSMLVQCRNAREVLGQLESRRHLVMNPFHFVEALV